MKQAVSLENFIKAIFLIALLTMLFCNCGEAKEKPPPAAIASAEYHLAKAPKNQ